MVLSKLLQSSQLPVSSPSKRLKMRLSLHLQPNGLQTLTCEMDMRIVFCCFTCQQLRLDSSVNVINGLAVFFLFAHL